jgi:hypothetical protein
MKLPTPNPAAMWGRGRLVPVSGPRAAADLDRRGGFAASLFQISVPMLLAGHYALAFRNVFS